MDPPRLKGLLNRESPTKARYDEARQRLLAIEARLNSAFEGD